MNKQEKRNFINLMGGVSTYNTTDKLNNLRNLERGFLNKTLSMFKYSNLPDTLPELELEKILQLNGICWVTEYKGNIVALPITLLHDKVDVYGNALQGNVYYPDVRTTELVNLKDGVLMINDKLGIGLTPIFNKYSSLINESEITLTITNMWKRTEKVFTANDDSTSESVKNYLEQVENGELGVIVSSLLYDSLNVTTSNVQGSSIHDLIEYDNYINSKFYNEIGLFINNNMKKERLITDEVTSNMNVVYPLVDNMLQSRREKLKLINEKFNLNIEVEFTSSWDYRINLGENLEVQDLEETNTQPEEPEHNTQPEEPEDNTQPEDKEN